MPFEIVRNDITNMRVDAIVNTANPRPVIGSGVDSAIHEKAGPGLLAARQQIGPIDMGCAAITPAFKLQAKYVVHTVGPVWDGGRYGEEQHLRNCYDNSLQLALRYNCESIAFPLVSTGNYGFPKDKALQVAIAAFSEFLLEHEMQIYLVVFDRKAFKLSEKLFCDVAEYIDQHYVDERALARDYIEELRSNRRHRDRELYEKRMLMPCAPAACEQAPVAGDLNRFLKQKDAGFVETLQNLIQESGQKNSTIYKKANISKQQFSKLINKPNTTITKPVAVAFALALELDLQQTLHLIGRAGYTLTNSSIFDMIIQYHIESRKFNVVEINVALYEYDQPLIGSV
jgi:O-acetyl-ADP-ribose deacetylase (regulator of RNase III)